MEGLIMLIFFLLSIHFASSDLFSNPFSTPTNQDYEACTPAECGGINITYPFYVAGQQASCGFPGFQVLCQKSLPLLNLSGDAYIINKISYTDQTLWVVNSTFSSTTLVCSSSSLTSAYNLTLNNKTLIFTSEPKEIDLFLRNCSAEWVGMPNYRKIICNNNSNRNSPSSLVGVYVEKSEWNEFTSVCESVSVPYIASGERKTKDKMWEGFPLKWIASSKCQSCQTSGGWCVYNQSTVFDIWCSCPDGFQTDGEHAKCQADVKMERSVVILVMGFFLLVGVVVFGAVLMIVICCLRLCTVIAKPPIKYASALLLSTRSSILGTRNVEEFIRSQESLTPKRYTYKDIKKMTKSFGEKLGEGGFSVVYKGILLDRRLVAVKLLKQTRGDGQDFINEVASISRTNHVNVVTLLGFCFEGRKRCLVYEFMPYGSLEKFRRVVANRSQVLSWEKLFRIALGIARGLEYLHRGCNTRILHLDIKPHNILLGEGFWPKISDFGLARLCSQPEQSNDITLGARGTIGYIAPEAFNRGYGDVSHKSDVYSYGMMILEVIGCRENAYVDTSSSEYFPQWIYRQLNRVEEPEGDEIINNEAKDLQRKLILVSLWCIQYIPSRRPSMGGVVRMLEGSLESIVVPPVPILCSPTGPQTDASGSSSATHSSSEFMRSSQHQELQQIPFTDTKSLEFPPGHSSCYRDPFLTTGFSLPAWFQE